MPVWLSGFGSPKVLELTINRILEDSEFPFYKKKIVGISQLHSETGKEKSTNIGAKYQEN